MFITSPRAVLCAIASCAFIPLAAQAAPVAYLNNNILTRIPAKDVANFKESVLTTLNSVPDGQTAAWASSPIASGQIQVTMQPQETSETKTAGTCRLLAADIQQRDQHENWKFWFCKQKDGSWKSSGSTLP